jgi:hypothetical protein
MARFLADAMLAKTKPHDYRCLSNRRFLQKKAGGSIIFWPFYFNPSGYGVILRPTCNTIGHYQARFERLWDLMQNHFIPQ